MKGTVLCGGASLLVLAWASGCQMPDLLRENTEGIKATSAAISRNTAAVADITRTMQELGTTLQLESALRKPMQDLAALGPTFSRMAALEGPMKDVADLRDPMRQLAALKIPLERVANLEQPMLDVANLQDPMVQLATLGGSLDEVAQLKQPMADVARLQEPLQTVGQLSRPVSAFSHVTPGRLARWGIPAAALFFLLLFATIWGAVRLALRHRSTLGRGQTPN